MTIKKSLGKFGSRFAFEFFLETMRGAMVRGVQKYLSHISAEDIPAMVRESKFPPLEHIDFSAVSGNADNLQKISLVRLVDLIAEARPDLTAAIQKTGNAGAAYMAQLRAHILSKLHRPVAGTEFKLEEGTVLAHCDKCDKRWPVKKDEASSIIKCPFCSAGEDEKKEPPAEDE